MPVDRGKAWQDHAIVNWVERGVPSRAAALRLMRDLATKALARKSHPVIANGPQGRDGISLAMPDEQWLRTINHREEACP